MSDEATARSTIDTLLERLQDFRADVTMSLGRMEQEITTTRQRLDEIEIRLDRLTSITHETRADFKEFRAQFKQPA